jgi:hypothetical protein
LEEHIPFIVRVDGDVGSSSEILVIGTMWHSAITKNSVSQPFLERGTSTYEAATLRELGLARAQFTFSSRYQKLFVNLVIVAFFFF